MVDRDQITTKIGRLEADLRQLRENQAVSKSAYRTNRDRQAIVERRFETAIQACLDIGTHIIAAEGYREPADYGDVFRVLEEDSLISPTVADRMVDMAGLRNVLAHEYAVIDHDRIYDQLQTLDHFTSFVEELDAALDLDQ